jgi:excisionase family DNA binding protein
MGNLLTVAVVAARLSVSEKMVYRLYWNGDLAGVKIGRCVRIYEDSLAAFLGANENVRPAPAGAPARRPKAAAGPTVFRYLPPENPAA